MIVAAVWELSPTNILLIARKLAVKFVSDSPSEELINRVAVAFQNSKCDIKTTLRALFYDKEFFAPENYRAKIKTPFELIISSLRTLDVKTEGSSALVVLLTKMGEPLYGYQAPTGYPDTAAHWVNTGALLERMNFAVALASNRIPQTNVDLKRFSGVNKEQILERSIKTVLNGEITAGTKSTLMRQLEQPLPEPKLTNAITSSGTDSNLIRDQRFGGHRPVRLRGPSGDPDVFKVVSLLIGSPDFQRQ